MMRKKRENENVKKNNKIKKKEKDKNGARVSCTNVIRFSPRPTKKYRSPTHQK
jgi:hypothetical protein